MTRVSKRPQSTQYRGGTDDRRRWLDAGSARCTTGTGTEYSRNGPRRRVFPVVPHTPRTARHHCAVELLTNSLVSLTFQNRHSETRRRTPRPANRNQRQSTIPERGDLHPGLENPSRSADPARSAPYAAGRPPRSRYNAGDKPGPHGPHLMSSSPHRHGQRRPRPPPLPLTLIQRTTAQGERPGWWDSVGAGRPRSARPGFQWSPASTIPAS